jgi:hypothetical protein
MCGDADDVTKPAIYAQRRSGVSGSTIVVAVSNCLFTGGGHEIYKVGGNPTVIGLSNVEGITAIGTSYPFRDINVYDFRQPLGITVFDYGSYGENSTKLLFDKEYTLTMIQSFVKPFDSRIVSDVEWLSSISVGRYDAFDIKSDHADYFFAYWNSPPADYTINAVTARETYVYMVEGNDATVEAVGVSYGDIKGWYNEQGTKLNDFNSGGNRKEMTSGKQDITIEQGANFKRSLIWKDKNAAPVDITGYSAKMSIRQRKSDSGALLTIRHNGSNPEIILGGATGTIDIDILASKTDVLTFKWGYYDLELTDGSSNVTRLLEGRVRLSKQVTVDADTT